jgi:hypothetical protein
MHGATIKMQNYKFSVVSHDLNGSLNIITETYGV